MCLLHSRKSLSSSYIPKRLDPSLTIGFVISGSFQANLKSRESVL